VLKDLPRGVRQPGDAFAAALDGKARDEIIEGYVRAFTTQKEENVFAKRLVVCRLIHWFIGSSVH
jgi:hypothetical protein